MLLILWLPIAFLIFLAGNIVRIIRFLRAPIPLRWELYPIPKGPLERQRHGGSYFENSNWWTLPEIVNRRGELVYIAKEVLLLKSVRQSFPSLWVWSWLLHWGLYLYISGSVLLGAGVLLKIELLRTFAAAAYWASCAGGLVGAAGLLVLRLVHRRLRAFTTRVSVFNLLLLGSTFASGLAALATVPAPVSTAGEMIQKSSGFSSLTLHVILVGLFLAYFPFTHMTHAYMKFFSWHGVRWDDSPAVHNPRAAEILAANLRRRVTWAASHISQDPTSTWSEVVIDQSGRGVAKRA
jgi:nitrate reductase gamma subunit